MIHNNKPESYTGTLTELAAEIGNLKYDALAEFLDLLSQKIKYDGDKDEARGRIKLASHLHNCADDLEKCKIEIEKAWVVCEPFM